VLWWLFKRSKSQFKEFLALRPFASPFLHRQVATQHRVVPDDMPELLVVLSDMQLGWAELATLSNQPHWSIFIVKSTTG
jgi:hypothetical protein